MRFFNRKLQTTLFISLGAVLLISTIAMGALVAFFYRTGPVDRARASGTGTTITVTSFDQENPLVTDSDCSLGEAIQAANSDTAVDECPAGTGADTIMLAQGIYNMTSRYPDAATSTYAFSGLPPISSPITITGTGIDSTILRRSNDAKTDIRGFVTMDDTFSILTVVSSGKLNLNDLNITGGHRVRGGYYPSGGIYSDGELHINSVKFDKNVGFHGGGIFLGGASTNASTIQNSVFENNVSNYGGAINIASSSLSITNTVFNNNSSYCIPNHPDGIFGGCDSGSQDYFRRSGGAIYCTGGNITLTDATLENNKAEYWGGAIYVGPSTADCDLNIQDSKINNNQIVLEGSAILLHQGNYGRTSSLNISNTEIMGNKGEDGNARTVSIKSTGTYNFQNIQFKNNQGSLFVDDLPTVNVSNSQIQGNTEAGITVRRNTGQAKLKLFQTNFINNSPKNLDVDSSLNTVTPSIQSLELADGVVTVAGLAPAGATLEFFSTNISGTEHNYYLTEIEGSNQDLDTGTEDGKNKFRYEIPESNFQNIGYLSVAATLSGQTSNFSSVKALTGVLGSSQVAGLVYSCVQTIIEGQTKCQFNLPSSGLSLPVGFKMAVGDDKAPSGECVKTLIETVFCAGVPTSSTSGSKPIFAQITTQSKIDTGEQAQVIDPNITTGTITVTNGDVGYTPNRGDQAPYFNDSQTVNLVLSNADLNDSDITAGEYTCTFEAYKLGQTQNPVTLGQNVAYNPVSGCQTSFTKAQRGSSLNWDIKVTVSKNQNPVAIFKDSYVFRIEGLVESGGGL